MQRCSHDKHENKPRSGENKCSRLHGNALMLRHSTFRRSCTRFRSGHVVVTLLGIFSSTTTHADVSQQLSTHRTTRPTLAEAHQALSYDIRDQRFKIFQICIIDRSRDVNSISIGTMSQDYGFGSRCRRFPNLC